MPQQYLLLQARELSNDGDYFMLVQPITKPWLQAISEKIALWQTLQKSSPDLDTISFHDNLEFRGDGEVTTRDPEGAAFAIDASELLENQETEYLLLDEAPVLPEPDSHVRGVSMVVDGGVVYWEGFQKHSSWKIESGGIPNDWFQEQLMALEAKA